MLGYLSKSSSPPNGREDRHLSTFGGHLVASSGEFVGTFLFLFMAYGGHLMAVTTATAADVTPFGTTGSTTIIYISFAYGFSLLVNVWAFFRVSGGLFNPAVTLGLVLSGGVPWIRGLFLVPSQLLASMCAGGLVEAMFPGNIANVNTLLNADTSIAQGVFLEMFFTSQLIIVVLMLAQEKSRDTFLAPVGIGLTVFVVEIPGVWTTGGSLNPARSFGCAVAARSFPGYHWIYWIGPCLGAVLATGYFWLIKFLHYEEANPGQDAPDEEAAMRVASNRSDL